MTSYQWLIVMICFILNFNDGIDVLLVSYSSNDIISQWGLSKTEMGYIFSVALAGMTLGAFLIAPQADRYGRRRIFLIAIGLIVIGLFGVGICDNYPTMLAMRFLTGLGIGGILPTMAATAAEFSNDKYRDFNVGLVQAGWPIGAIFTGLLCAKYLPLYGWQNAFLLAGCIAFLMWLMVFFFMSDSLEFMLENQASQAQLAKLMNRMHLSERDFITYQPKKITKQGPSALFASAYQSNTLKLWSAAFFGFLTLYTLMSWIPNIAKDAGLPFHLATGVGIALNVGAAIGSSSIGALGSKFGLRQSILVFMITAFLIMQIYAFSTLNTTLIFVLVFLIGIFVQGGFNGIWPTLARVYPAQIRTTGVGYTVGIGRLGAIFGPLIFGYLSDSGMSITMLFVLFSLPLLGMGVSIWTLNAEELKK